MALDTIQPQLSIVFPCSAVGHWHTLIINPLVYVTFTLIILSFLFCHFSDQAFKMEVIVVRIAPFSFPFIFSTQVWLVLVCMFVCHFHHPNMHYSFLTYPQEEGFCRLTLHCHLDLIKRGKTQSFQICIYIYMYWICLLDDLVQIRIWWNCGSPPGGMEHPLE